MAALSVLDPVQSDLELVEAEIQRVGQVEYSFLENLLQHVLSTQGKRIRPALVLLAASFHQYRLQFLVPLAAAIELLHTATLVHDDLVDNSPTRRGKPTLHSLTDRAVTVLVGDYLFANAAALCTETQNTRVMQVFGRTLMTICEGELKQIFTAGFWRQSREDYYQKIERKTASLIRTATETGAILSGAPEEQIDALRSYGYNLGMAFQIVDDILDFVGNEALMGKPVGSDLRQGTVTLPTIRLLEEDPDNSALRRVFDDGDSSDEAIREAIAAVHRSSGIDYARAEARRFADLAVQQLDSLPPTPERAALESISEYVLDRMT
ncbi:MAG TPA: polyprenyl synthetase family protein [Chloroflexota bacterium]|nr:polyprenyl synthetase family protein [Chloroflexota bacterium]